MRTPYVITVSRPVVPLLQPYRLVLGAVERYDSLIVETADRESGRGAGEATVQTGSTRETGVKEQTA